MADSKVSELTAASSASGSDLLYLVQSSTSKKISVGNFFNSAHNPNLIGNVSITGTETVTGSGFLSVVKPISSLVGGGALTALSLPNGLSNGQLKIVTFTTQTSGGTFTINAGNIAGSVDVQFKREGDSAILLYVNSKWHVLGGTANVIY